MTTDVSVLDKNPTRSKLEIPMNKNLIKKRADSIVVMDSKTLQTLREMPGRIDSNWDNLGYYNKKKDLWIDLIQNNSNAQQKFNVLNQIIGIQNKKLSSEIRSQRDWLLLSSATSMIFLLLSEKGRRWAKNLCFLGIFGGVGVTIC